MIITCPKDSKKFEVDSKMIPEEGRLLQCGSCGYKWHFKKEIIAKEIITKNKGSFRSIDVDPKALKFLQWWISTVEKYKPKSNWLFPAFRGDRPISDKGISNTMWSTYAEYGLAKIQ